MAVDHARLGLGVEAPHRRGVDVARGRRGPGAVRRRRRARARGPRRGSAPTPRAAPGGPWPGCRPPPGPPSRGPRPVRGRRGRRRSRISASRPDRRGPGGAWSGPWRASPGSGDISSSHLGHSVLAISMATGEPRVRPWRIAGRPAVISSASNRMRGPRPKPRRRRASSPAISSAVIGRPAGKPFDDHDEGLAVGLSGGQEPEHAANLLPVPCRAARPGRFTPRPARSAASACGPRR